MTMRLLTRLGAVWAAVLACSIGTAKAADVTLHMLMEDVPETTIVEQLLPAFQKETGIKVEIQKLVYSDMHDKLVPQLISNESFYNVLEVDFLWAGEFSTAGWLEDLKPYADKSGFDTEAFIPSMMDLVGYQNGALLMIPMYNYSMGLIYRKDLLTDPKLQAAYKAATGKDLAPPSDLAAYVELAKFMKKNAGVAGAAMQSQKGDPNSMEFSNYLFSSGGRYLDDGGKVAFASPEAERALTLYVDAIQNAAQQGALSATLDDTLRLMCDGKAFSMVTYWWMLPQVDDRAKCPAAAGRVALSVMPGGHGESGGWGWGVPKNQDQTTKDAAWRFIAWVQSKKIAVERARMGHAPVRQDVFEDQEVLARYPFYKDAEQIVASGRSFPIFVYSAQYEDVLGTQLSLAASGGAKPMDAIRTAAQGLEDLLAKAR